MVCSPAGPGILRLAHGAAAVMSRGVLGLHGGGEEEGEVEGRVAAERNQVEQRKVERQPDHRTAHIVLYRLRVEGRRPRREIRPAEDTRQAARD